MWTDPIVAEIHEIRRQMAAEHGNDLHALGRHLMERQKDHADRLIAFPPRRPVGWQASPLNNTQESARVAKKSSP